MTKCWRDAVAEMNAPLVRGDPCECGQGDGLGLDFDNGDRVCYSCGRPMTGGPPHAVDHQPD